MGRPTLRLVRLYCQRHRQYEKIENFDKNSDNTFKKSCREAQEKQSLYRKNHGCIITKINGCYTADVKHKRDIDEEEYINLDYITNLLDKCIICPYCKKEMIIFYDNC